MRILFTRFPLESIARGGAEKQVMSLMEGLREEGHDVRFLGSCPVLLEQCTQKRFRTVHLDIGPPPVTKASVCTLLFRAPFIRRALCRALDDADWTPNAVVLLSLSEKLLLTDIAAARKITILWIEHDPVGRWLTWNPWLPLLRRQSRRATMVTVSELSRKIYLRLGFDPDGVAVIPNGMTLPNAKDSSVSNRTASHDHPFTIGCVARLAYEKGIDVLLQAMVAIPSARLRIVGGGPEHDRLDAMIQMGDLRANLQERVTIEPAVEDIVAFYRSMDVVVLPSRSNDPFGLVIAEAMAAGTACIVTDACGIAEFLRDRFDAMVCAARSSTSMMDALCLLEDPSIRGRIAEQGKKTARTLFSLNRMVERYERLICEPPILIGG